MDTLLQILVTGALTSGVLALLALGFSLVYGVGGVINLAHGSFFLVGAYAAVSADSWGFPIILSIAFGVLAAGASGFVVDQLAVRPMGHSEINILISTLAAALFISAAARFIYGPADRGLPGLGSGALDIIGVRVQTTRVVAFLFAVAAVALVMALLRLTAAGRVMRAVAQDTEAATLMGIDTGRVRLAVTTVGAALAGLAGVLVSPFEVVNPTIWQGPLIDAFAIVIVGGLGSIEGTLLAALVLGYLDRSVAFLLPTGERFAPLIALTVILVTLVARPRGLLGRRTGH